MHGGERGARDHRDKKTERPGIESVGAPEAEEGAHQHHPLEADVDDPAPLREKPAHRCERERGRIAEGRAEEHRPGEDEVEVPDA